MKRNSNDEDKIADLTKKMDRAILIFDALEKEVKILRQACYFENTMGYVDSAHTMIIIQRIVALIACEERNGISHDAIKAARTYLSGAASNIVAYKANVERLVTSQFGEVHAETVLGYICPIIECLDQIQRSYENNERRTYWINSDS